MGLWTSLQPYIDKLKEDRGPVTYGFPRSALKEYFGGNFNELELDAVQRLAAGTSTLSDAGYYKEWKNRPASSPLGGTNVYEVVVAGLQHLSQHPAGSKQGGALGGSTGTRYAGFNAVETPEDYPGAKAKASADALKNLNNTGSVGARRGRVDIFTRTPAFGLLGAPQLSSRTLGGKSLLG